jgi:hypothetical protein
VFKEQLHKEIDEIEFPTSQVFETIDKAIERGRKSKTQKKRSKLKTYGAITSMAATAVLASGLFFFLQKEEVNTGIESMKQNNIEAKADVPQNPSKTSDVKIDLEKERQALKKDGFFVSRSDLPAETNEEPEGLRILDISHNLTLKDYVSKTDTILKGKVLGTRSYIDDTIVRTEVKLLVDESLSGNTQPGQVYTFVITGGIITEYDFWKLNGNKNNLNANELEAAKNKLVVDDAMGTLVYPEDEMYVFVGKDTLTNPSSKEEMPMASLQIKYTGGKIDMTTHFELAESYFSQELQAMKSVSELHNKLEKLIAEKKGYSKER